MMTARSVFVAMAALYVVSFVFYPAMSRVWSEVDMPLHFLGGFLAGMLGIACWDVLRKRYGIKGVPAWLVAILAVCFASLIATCWEFYEFAMDWINQSRGLVRSWQQPSLPDTMMDLFLGLVGAAASTLAFRKRL